MLASATVIRDQTVASETELSLLMLVGILGVAVVAFLASFLTSKKRSPLAIIAVCSVAALFVVFLVSLFVPNGNKVIEEAPVVSLKKRTLDLCDVPAVSDPKVAKGTSFYKDCEQDGVLVLAVEGLNEKVLVSKEHLLYDRIEVGFVIKNRTVIPLEGTSYFVLEDDR